MRSKVCVVMHDVSPATWPECLLLLDALQGVAGPAATTRLHATLLVVPSYHRGTAAWNDPSFIEMMDERLAAGDELALHGYRHYDDAPYGGLSDRLKRGVYTAREGEFSALTYEEALQRLQFGAEWFASNGWPLKGFVAPAWLMNESSRRALEALPLTYTTSLTRFYTLPDRRSIATHSLVYSARSALRRTVSRIWIEHLMRRMDEAPVLRLGLHPVDAHCPDIVLHWQHLFARALESREPITKAGFAAELAAEFSDEFAANVRYSSQTETSPIAAPTSAPPRTSLG